MVMRQSPLLTQLVELEHLACHFIIHWFFCNLGNMATSQQRLLLADEGGAVLQFSRTFQHQHSVSPSDQLISMDIWANVNFNLSKIEVKYYHNHNITIDI